MKRLYLLMLINALMVSGLVLIQIWGGAPFTGNTLFRLIGSGVITGLYLTFINIFRMDFSTLESKRLGYAILGFVTGLTGMAFIAIWDLIDLNEYFFKITATLTIFLGLSFYLLSLREDIVREKRQKDKGFLD